MAGITAAVMKTLTACVFGGILFGASAEGGNATGSPQDNAQSQPRIWALLVAGSYGYIDYRHQADVCHAYQVLHHHGVPDNRIVVMMYDDIANNPKNPTKGVVINHPKGPNVYKGVPKDYTGVHVTSKNFLKILKGDNKAMHGIGSGKVINSKPTDHIFVYFAGHGSPGLIRFPNESFYADELVKTLKEMHAKKRFAKLVFYLEACESGSMFDKILPKNINVYATTAASPDQTSWSCYYDKFLNANLGDEYSVNWMEDSDVKNLRKETLQKQYQIVKKKTHKSTVQHYGDLSIGKISLSRFQGYKTAKPLQVPSVACYAVNSREVPVVILKRQIETATDSVTRMKLQKELEQLLSRRKFLETSITRIVEHLKYHKSVFEKPLPSIQDRDCYRHVVDHFDKICFQLSRNTYALGFMHVFVNMCASTRPNKTNEILAALDTVCVFPKTEDIV